MPQVRAGPAPTDLADLADPDELARLEQLQILSLLIPAKAVPAS